MCFISYILTKRESLKAEVRCPGGFTHSDIDCGLLHILQQQRGMNGRFARTLLAGQVCDGRGSCVSSVLLSDGGAVKSTEQAAQIVP